MLDDKNYKVNLKCVFCKASSFELLFEGYQPVSGDLIRCANCDQSNDFTFIKRTSINKTLETIQNDVQNEMIKMFKKAGFKVK